MFSNVQSWFSGNSKRKSISGRRNSASLRLVTLEDRSLLSSSFSLDTLINTFNSGALAALNNSVVNQVATTLGADLPLIKENLSEVTGLANEFKKVFGESLSKSANTTLADLKNQLHHPELGFFVNQLDASPDANGNLVQLEYQKDIPLNIAFNIGGKTSFSYFDDFVNGSLAGNIAVGKTTLHVDVKYGLDVVNNTPTFFLSDGSKITLDPIKVDGAVTGELAIKSLADVNANGKIAGSLQGSVTVTDSDGVPDHKVRIAGLASSLGGNVSGDLSLNFDGSKDAQGKAFILSASFPILGTIEIGGKLGATLNNSQLSFTDTLASKTSATDLIRGAANNLFSIFGGNNLPILGNSEDASTDPNSSTNLKSLLTTPIPLTGGKTILDELGLTNSKAFKFLLNGANPIAANADLASIQKSLKDLGIELFPGKTLADADKIIKSLIHGDKVDLIHFRSEDSLNIADHVTLANFITPIIGPITASVSVGIDASVHAGYRIGLGFDTTGFYLDQDTSVQIGGGIDLSATGSVSIAGLIGLGVKAGVGVSVEAGVKFYDPDPTDGKIYYDEIFNTDKSKSTIDNFLNSMTFYAQAQLQGDIQVVLQLPLIPDVTLLEKQFKGDAFFSTSQDKHLTTADGKNSFRKIALVPTSSINAESLVKIENGQHVLVIDSSNDTAAANVHLGSSTNGKVDVTIFGKGLGTTTSKIDKVRFVGSKFNDRLDVDPSFNIPVQADGGAGDDYLTGGLANDSLNGGDGSDNIFGGDGNDVITGGAGRNLLHGGAGNDSLTAGNDGDVVDGDEGNDTLIGGLGRDVLNGGIGNDQLTGGDGAQLIGGDGNDVLTGTTGKSFFDGGAGNDSITGGTGDDTIFGGVGNDTLLGGDGNDVLSGGVGNDRIEGGNGNDVLRGDEGVDLLIGGNGDDRLSGGKDADTLFGDDQAGLGAQSGRDTFEIDFANDFGSGIDQFSGGPDRDYIAVVGQTQTDSNGNPVFTDDIKITSGATAGVVTAGWRPLGSTGAYQQISFRVPGDIDAIVVEAGAGNDRVELDPTLRTAVQANGGDGDDTILGSDGPDSLYGGAGNDTIDGRGGADSIFGDGDGNQVVVLVGGNDTIQGGAGEDNIDGGPGNDRIDGGTDHDFIHGGLGDDILTGGTDNFGNTISGDDGNDIIIGSDGSDDLSGGSGNDTILGGDGGDTIKGDAGDDLLIGEFGRDNIQGGVGDDVLKAYVDNDVRASISLATGISLPALTTPMQAQDVARLTALNVEEQSINNNPVYQQLLTVPVAQLTLQQKTDLTRFQNHLVDIHNLQDDLLRFNSKTIDSLSGEDGNDTLFGSPYNDRLDGGFGSDTIEQSDLGEFGSDSIIGGDSLNDNDAYVIHGTDLADQITLTYDADGKVTVLGTAGKVLGHFGNTQFATAFSGIESLRIKVGGGNDTVSLSGLGQKVAFVGQIEVFGEDGDDIIDATSYQGKTLLDGGNGNDFIKGGAIEDVINGGAGNDVIVDASGNNVIDGGDGNDTITGGAGNDTISGGAGDDVISAKDGNDVVDGGDGNDKIDGGLGNDTIHGGAGDDRILAGGGDDVVFGDAGNDDLYGMAGNDYLNGGDGNDTVNGDGVYLLIGGADGVILVSDNTPTDGNDTLVGGRGADRLFGDGGNDLLDNSSNGSGDLSTDTLDGGVGFDTVIVSFKNHQTWTSVESVQISNPTGGLTQIGADQSVYGLENGVVWANGKQVNANATDFGVNQRGELFVLTSGDTLIKYTRNASGLYSASTFVHAGVMSFDGFDANGNPLYELFPHDKR